MIPATPYLHLDPDRARANIARVAESARSAGVALRPHAKTHKSPQIAHWQLETGAVGLTVATIGEAETFAAHGVTDLFIAYPLWLDAAAADRLRAVAGQARIGIGVDSVTAGRRAADLLDGSGIYGVVEVDSGHHRTGVTADEAGSLAAVVTADGLEIRGVFTFPGHSYSPAARRQAANDEALALTTAVASLSRAGVTADVVSGGSTPSLAYSSGTALTELRPGVYVFGDAHQWELGAVPPEHIALTCRGTVVSRRPGRYVVDAGSKAIGADRAEWATGFGRILDDPDARIVSLSEHHAVVESSRPAPDLGSVVDVVPNHVCNAVNLHDQMYVGAEATPWPVAARGRNS